jgi:hypothetical protein
MEKVNGRSTKALAQGKTYQCRRLRDGSLNTLVYSRLTHIGRTPHARCKDRVAVEEFSWRIWLARFIPASGTLTAFITPERCGDSRGSVGGTTCSLGLSVVHCRWKTDIYNPCTPIYPRWKSRGASVRLHPRRIGARPGSHFIKLATPSERRSPKILPHDLPPFWVPAAWTQGVPCVHSEERACVRQPHQRKPSTQFPAAKTNKAPCCPRLAAHRDQGYTPVVAKTRLEP